MKRRRRIKPAKIRERLGGGWYERIPVQEKKACGCTKGEPCPTCGCKGTPPLTLCHDENVDPAASQRVAHGEEDPFPA